MINSEFEQEKERILNKIKSAENDDYEIGIIQKLKIEIKFTGKVKIITEKNTICVNGPLIITSTQELIRKIKDYYVIEKTFNKFPEIVDNYLNGTDQHLCEVPEELQFQVKNHLVNLSKIIRHGDGVVIISNYKPTPITEFIVDGENLSGITLKEIRPPIIIIGQNSDFSDLKVLITKIKNNIISTKRGKNYALYADIISIFSIISVGFGIAFLLIKRGRFWEAGIPMILMGLFLLYIRFFSEWGKIKFSTPNNETIEGNALLITSFYGKKQSK